MVVVMLVGVHATTRAMPLVGARTRRCGGVVVASPLPRPLPTTRRLLLGGGRRLRGRDAIAVLAGMMPTVDFGFRLRRRRHRRRFLARIEVDVVGIGVAEHLRRAALLQLVVLPTALQRTLRRARRGFGFELFGLFVLFLVERQVFGG